MSLSYRVTLQVSEVVNADDKTVHQLDLRPVLERRLIRQDPPATPCPGRLPACA